MKRQTHTLTTLLLISTFLVAAVGAYLKFGLLAPLGIQREESIVAMPFVMLSDDALRFMVDKKQEQLNVPPQSPTEAPDATVLPTEPTAVPEETEAQTPPAEPVYIELDESWFDDVLFIGDSRTAGLKNYYRLGNADYFTNIGMNIYNVFLQMSSDTNMDATLLEDLLQKKTYGKIFIGIGLNECNYEYEFIEDGFRQLIDMIQTYQPDTKIVLQSIMMVSEAKAKSNWYFDQENLGEINRIIQSFADGENVFYLESNDWNLDENGYLPAELTHDGIHLYGTGYEDWALWIMEQSGWLGIP